MTEQQQKKVTGTLAAPVRGINVLLLIKCVGRTRGLWFLLIFCQPRLTQLAPSPFPHKYTHKNQAVLQGYCRGRHLDFFDRLTFSSSSQQDACCARGLASRRHPVPQLQPREKAVLRRVKRAWVIPPISLPENYRRLPHLLVQVGRRETGSWDLQAEFEEGRAFGTSGKKAQLFFCCCATPLTRGGSGWTATVQSSAEPLSGHCPGLLRLLLKARHSVLRGRTFSPSRDKADGGKGKLRGSTNAVTKLAPFCMLWD